MGNRPCMDALRANIRKLMAGRTEKEVGEKSGVGQTWLNRAMNPDRDDGIRSPGLPKLRQLARYFGVPVERLLSGAVAADASQPARLDDETMAQAVELLYLIADIRPDDPRFVRITWPMILVAAKAVAKAGSQRETVRELLEALERV